MRIRRLISLLVLPLALAGCGDSTGPKAPPEIEGSWLRGQEQPTTPTVLEHLGFGTGGRYARDLQVYRDAALGTPLSSFREEGTYRLRGERLELRITRTTEWNAQTGGPPVVTDRPGMWVDAGIVRISGNTMDRTYVSGPLDAPVETKIRYFKALED